MVNALRRAARAAAVAVAVLGSGALLAGCIGPPVTATGSGVVTISWSTWDGTAEGAEQYTPASGGDRLALCADGVESCHPDVATVLYFYDPGQGDLSAVLSTSTVVALAAGGTTTIPPGHYTLQAVGFDSGGQSVVRGAPLNIYIGPTGEKDLTIWHQSLARPSGQSACPEGYTPSWAQWPGNGEGGYVCNRQVYAYYPDEPVRPPGWDSSAPQWLVSVGRDSAEAPCAEGFTPSWAQWPGNGEGGYVCNQLSS